MPNIRIYPAGATLPAAFPKDGSAFVGYFDAFTDDEKAALVAAGVWREADAANWARATANGSVWAGGVSGQVAQVRGKAGRKLPCVEKRSRRLPPGEKRRTRSLQLSDVAVQSLEAMARAQAQAPGQKVTISMVVEDWARQQGRAS